MNFFCSTLCKDLSDYLTEIPIVKNSIVDVLMNKIALWISVHAKWLDSQKDDHGYAGHVFVTRKVIITARVRSMMGR